MRLFIVLSVCLAQAVTNGFPARPASAEPRAEPPVELRIGPPAAQTTPRAGLGAPTGARTPRHLGRPLEVDLELVLAADISGSVLAALVATQRHGVASALRDPRLRRALASGPNGRVALVYVEWAGPDRQDIVVPWTVRADAAGVEGFARALETAPPTRPGGETSISGAIGFARRLIDGNGIDGLRRVIDLASNGTHSAGPPLADLRADLWTDAVTVNALVLPGPGFGETGRYATLFTGNDSPLIGYFDRAVIGGPGAFAQTVEPERGFRDAMLRKMILDVAWTE